MSNTDNDNILNYAIENGILDLEYVRQQINMQRRKTLLAKHKYNVWQGSNGSWYTYLPNAEKKRILKKKNTKEEIENLILEYYKAERDDTLNAIIKSWLTDKLEYNEISKQTYDRYYLDYERFFKDTDIGDTPIGDIEEYVLENFIRATVRDMELTSKGYSKLRLILKGAFKYAHKRKMTNISIGQFLEDINLSSKIFTKKEKTPAKIGFNDIEVARIEEWIWRHDASLTNLAILLGFYTGMRVGEIVALKIDDIDFENNVINVNKTETKYKADDGTWVYEVRDGAKTEAGNRQIVLSDKAICILERMKAINPHDSWLVLGRDGRVKEQNVTHKLYYICDTLKIPRRSMHKTRKTYCTKMLNAGVSEAFIISQMGHTDIATSKDHYYFDNYEKDKAKIIVNKAINY